MDRTYFQLNLVNTLTIAVMVWVVYSFSGAIIATVQNFAGGGK